MGIAEILIIVGAVLFVTAVTTISIIRKKKGKTSCGCGCAGCTGCKDRTSCSKK